MSVPSRDKAAAVLLELRPAPRLLRHMTVVAEVAAFLATRMCDAGTPVDRRLVMTAALLHDLDKALPGGDPLKQLGHGHAGAQWLTDHGYAELAPPVDWHPVSRLGEDATYEQFLLEGSWEVRIVVYADKRAAQRLQSLEARFGRWSRSHPELAETLARARARAEALEQLVCETAGIRPTQVRRLRWVSTALQHARANARAA